MNNMRILSIDYGDSRVGVAISDPLGITAQGLETISRNGSDKAVLSRLEEIINEYGVTTIVIGLPVNMNGTKSERVEVTEQFIHKLKCRFPKISIERIDERLTTVEAHKTMNFLNVNKYKKKDIVDTISAVYILETYLKKIKWREYNQMSKDFFGEEEQELENGENDLFVLNDEDGNEIKFEFLDLIDFEDESYVVLYPVENDAEEVVILKVQETEGEQDEYVSVDEKTLKAVYEIFKEKFKDVYDFQDQ